MISGWLIAGGLFTLASLVFLWSALKAGSDEDDARGYDDMPSEPVFKETPVGLKDSLVA
jgi:hypothetical protein